MNYITEDWLAEITLMRDYFNMLGLCKTYQIKKGWPIEAYNVMGAYARELYLSLGDKNGKQKSVRSN